jgi:hypothetical protein
VFFQTQLAQSNAVKTREWLTVLFSDAVTPKSVRQAGLLPYLKISAADQHLAGTVRLHLQRTKKQSGFPVLLSPCLSAGIFHLMFIFDDAGR